METLDQINKILRQVFSDESIGLNLNSTADDIEEWDSFAHLNVIMSIENHFNIQISDAEAPTLRSIDKMVELINIKSKNNLN